MTTPVSQGPLIRLEDIHLSFGARKILTGVSMQFEPGRNNVVIGPSGSGKSTILRLVSGLLKPTAGRIFVDDLDITTLDAKALNDYRLRMGFLFQYSALFDSMTVGQNVAFPITEHERRPADEVQRVVTEKLGIVNLSGIEHLLPANLSGGMQKRVSLARAIARDPSVILYDEPTAGLDPVTSTVIEDLIDKLTRELQTTTVVVTHQLSTIARGGIVYMLFGGKVVGVGTPDELKHSEVSLVRDFIAGNVTPELTGD
jgi:phospholipid/cholesterol/gamma-HCH transport system ATP-binding protein